MSNNGSPEGLKERVVARDRLHLVAEHTRQALTTEVAQALSRGDLEGARAALSDSESHIAELAESLRIYQAELHAQADELSASQARTERVLTRFATLFAHMPVAAMTVGPRGDVLDFNARADALLGLHGRIASSRFLHRMVDAAAYQSVVRPAMLAAQDTGPITLEGVAFVATTGRRFIGELHVSWLPADVQEGAEPGGHHVCAIVDRTEALQAMQALRASEAALREREALLAQTARLARVGGWALVLQPAQAWQATDQLRELLDLSPDENLSLPLLLRCCFSADRLRLSQALQRAAEGEAIALELDLVTPSGQPLRAAVSAHAERADGETGAVRRVVGLLQDISRSHDDQRRIGELSERLALVNEAGGVGGWDWDLITDQVEIDERMARLLALPGAGPLPAPQLRQALEAVLLREEAERLDAALLSAVQQGGAVNLELRRRPGVDGVDGARGQAAPAWLHMTGRAHADADGRVLRIAGCAWEHHTHDPATRR